MPGPENFALPFMVWKEGMSAAGWGFGAANPIYFDDYTVKRGESASIRIEAPSQNNSYRELENMNSFPLNHNWQVNAGDRIILKVWCKTAPSTIGTPSGERALNGPNFSFDLAHGDAIAKYGNGYVNSIFNQDSFNQENTRVSSAINAFCPMDLDDWTQLTVDVVIPETIVGHPWHPGIYHAPFNCTPIMYGGTPHEGTNEHAHTWFVDPEEYYIPAGTIMIDPYIPPVIADPPLPPQQNRSLAARVPMLGNSMLVQYHLRRLRDKYISKEWHKRLHPLV